MDYVQLIGAETVQSAGVNMRNAADQMSRAASQIEDSLQRHQRFLDDWLQRLSDVFDAARGGERE
jgi:hypothetical protein